MMNDIYYDEDAVATHYTQRVTRIQLQLQLQLHLHLFPFTRLALLPEERRISCCLRLRPGNV